MRSLLAAITCLAVTSFQHAYGDQDEPRMGSDVNVPFTFSLSETLETSKGNLVWSPLSVWSTLAMTSTGASGETLRELQSVLHLTGEEPHLYDGITQWRKELQAGSEQVKITIGDRIWVDKGVTVQKDFKEQVQNSFDGAFAEADFAHHPEAARTEINRWVSNKTEEKIPNLLGAGDVTASSKIILTNAVYFNGEWEMPFDGHLTHERDFRTEKGTVRVPTMKDARSALYYEDDEFQALQLPYKGGALGMVFVLRRDSSSSKDEGVPRTPSFDQEKFLQILGSLQMVEQVMIQIPKFTMEYRTSLEKPLSEVGLSRVFTNAAQFDRMATEPLKISTVVHQAWIEVGEKGTEAAAATAVAMLAGAAMPKQEVKKFSADHPFLFYIVDMRNQGILFAGKVADPSRKR